MKKIILIFTITVGLFGASCKKYLDINTNPNSVSTAGPSIVLPLAIVNTASLTSNLNDYGSQTCGYLATAGGYGSFGSSWTYDYTPSQGDGIWQNGYTYAENLQYIINSTDGSDVNAYYNASAKIMKAFIFQQLVDEFGNIPYSQALKGDTILRPKYDDAGTIYVSLASLLDSAIAEINAAQAPVGIASDPLFGGNMTSWKQFANTLKLRLIIRASAVVKFANTTFSSDGFLTNDAVVNPGYKLANSTSGTQVSPSWNSWVASYTGSRANAAWIPATFVFGYYDSVKLYDPARGDAIYLGFDTTSVMDQSKAVTNQLGFSAPLSLSSPAGSGSWYSGTGSGTSLGNAIGVMKGPDMGEPLILLAESDFLQAEADIRGILSQDATTDFNNGILASFTYLDKLSNGSVSPNAHPAAEAAAYQAFPKNAGSYLVNFSKATTPAQQLEAIITQKYIAMNFISGQEAWSEYRRTGYPVSSATVINNPYGSIASTQSQATRPDHLPTRLPYPDTESATNGTNVPQNISFYTSTIFWAK